MMITKPWQLTAAQYTQLHDFIADRIHDEQNTRGIAISRDPLLNGLNAQLLAHGELIEYRDHSLDGKDAGLIDGLGLALRYTAVGWREHPDYLPEWAPPGVPPLDLLEYDYR